MTTSSKKRSANDLEKQYPNEAQFVPGDEMKLNPDNYFRDMDIALVRKKYVHFTIFMEQVHNQLDLPLDADIDTLVRRIYDLAYAANQKD